jgi:anti-anti-sigma regulatory factor
MNTTIDLVATQTDVAAQTKKTTDSPAFYPTTQPQASGPATIVLQPNGSLDCYSSAEFQQRLEEALVLSGDGVIVDLLWVDSTDSCGVAALVAGIQQAAILGKMLSFQSMDVSTRTALEIEWIRQREISFGPWNDLFGTELEQFLDSLFQN